MRTFCLLNSVVYLCGGILISFYRLLGGVLVDAGPVQVAGPLLAQEMLCAASMVVLAALLLWVRESIPRDQAAAARAGRSTRGLALAIAAISAVGMLLVSLLPIGESTLPTVLVTICVFGSALYTYAALAKLPRALSL